MTTVIVTERTRVLDGETRTALSSFDAADGTLVFDRSTPLLGALERDDVLVSDVADAAPYGFLRTVAEERSVLELHGTTVQRFQFGVGAGGQRLLMRGSTIRENGETGRIIPNVEPRPTWQAARVYDLGTASEAGDNLLVDNGDYQLFDARPTGARQQVDASTTVIGPNAPSTLVLSGPLDDPPRWTIVDDGVQIEFW